MKATWQAIPLRAVFRRRVEDDRPDLPLLSVYRDLGIVPREGREDNYNRPSEDLSSYQVVRPGDLVMNKMKTWQGSIGISDYLGIVSPAYFVADQVGEADSRFLHHLLRSGPLIAEYGARSKGIRPAQWDLPWESFREIVVRLPPSREQRSIADFLDAETARIDGLLELRQKQSELVTERHLVARDRILGVDRAGTRPLAPLRAMVTHIIDTAHATAPQSDSGTHSVIRTSEIRGGRLFVDQAYKTDDASYRRWTARGRPAAGDILLTREAPAGEACVVPPNAEICIGQRVVLLRVNRATAIPEFLVEALYARPARDFLRDMGRETTVSHLNMGDIPRIPMPNTSVIDQHSALRSLAAEADMASGLARSLGRQRKLLQERRQALITAAVTGEIDVSTASGRGVPA